MTPGFAARRRAEEFNSLVEGTSTEELQPARYSDALDLIESLREMAPVEPRAEFVADLRRELMTEAATVLTPTAARLTVTPRRSPRERRIAVAIGGFAVISATTSMAMAAQTALPGDTLYPLKRALENASTTITFDEDAKGASLLAHATDRLAEVDELTRERDDSNGQAVADTLHAFSDQATSASDLMIAAYNEKGRVSNIEDLRAFTAQSMTALGDLEAVVPDTARAALIEAAQVITLIDSEAIRLCPSCGGGVTQVPEFQASSIEDILEDLGSALPAPPPSTPVKSPSSDPGPSGASDPDGGTSEPTNDDPEPDGPSSPSGDGSGGGGGGTAEGDTNVIEDLTDRLTGGNGSPENSEGTLTDVLGDAVDGIVGNLLGN
jgi:hypothetical protein